jgi:hypothetical protein
MTDAFPASQAKKAKEGKQEKSAVGASSLFIHAYEKGICFTQ